MTKKTREPMDLGEAFEKTLSKARQLDEQYHLEGLLEQARNLVTALELAVDDKQPRFEGEDWTFCLAQLDVVNNSMMNRDRMLRNLSLAQSADDHSVIPF